jgi:acyl dehydratase
MRRRTTRELVITEELVRAYSRRGNYHSDAALSAGLKLPGLVAQGMQAAGPAYGALLDAWGETFLDNGEVDMRFVGIVLAGDTVEAVVTVNDDGTATFEVANTTSGRTAVAGNARRTTNE